MTRIHISGSGFQGGNDGPAPLILFMFFSDTLEGPLSANSMVINPSLPDNGYGNDSDFEVVDWTDTDIEVDIKSVNRIQKFLRSVSLRDENNGDLYSVDFDDDPDEALASGVITVSYDEIEDEIVIISVDPIFPVVGDEVYWLDITGSVNAAVGAVYVSDTELRYSAAAYGGDAVSTVLVSRGEGYGERRALAASEETVFLLPATTYPLIESICSPSADTIRFEGQRFLTATVGQVGYVVTRLADYSAAGPNELQGTAMIYEFADGSPDPVYDWVLVTHTDNVIEISNPRFSLVEPSMGPGDFVVTGAAFHDPTATTMYYYEPWGETFSTPVDGAGCP